MNRWYHRGLGVKRIKTSYYNELTHKITHEWGGNGTLFDKKQKEPKVHHSFYYASNRIIVGILCIPNIFNISIEFYKMEWN